MKRITGDQVFAATLLLITALYLALDYSYKPSLRTAPAIIAWIMLLLLTLDLSSRIDTPFGRALRRRLNPPTERLPFAAAHQLEAILWVVSFAAALVVIGVLYAVPAFVFAFMRFRGGRPVWASALGGGAVTLFVWLLFAQLLRLDLYPGLVFGGA